MLENKFMKRRDLLIHLLCWSIVFLLPLVFYRPIDSWEVRLSHWARSLGGSLGYMLMFYVNYLWLIPRFYFTQRQGPFALANVVCIVLALVLSFGWWTLANHYAPLTLHRHGLMHVPYVAIVLRSLIMLFLVAGLSLTVRLSQRWQHLEEARREAEKARSEAELSNLRNQLNPHFLLNTLNNIYALIAFAPNKAQGAVERLSKLLRHVLYDNEQTFVPLYQEVAFVNNYIDLMKIRVTQNVTIEQNIDVSPNDASPIAPLIFISLIENAFKHGISSMGAGYIKIDVHKAKDNSLLVWEICNSNHPKRATDKSGSGIGLQQVEKRLQLIYPNSYTWHKGLSDDGKEYCSKITIDLRGVNGDAEFNVK